MRQRILEPLRPVGGHPNLFTARKGAARMMAVALPDAGLMLYSPVPDPTEEALDAARKLGGVGAIIAPSPFHHLGVASWHTAFPDATVHAPEGAITRLEKRLGQVPSADLPTLPNGMAFLAPVGLKAPELWLSSQGSNGTLWAVCDAFAGPPGADDAPAEAPKARGAFATMCLGDPPAYKAWASNQIEVDSPTILLPAHGNRVEAAALPQYLSRIVEDL